MKILALILSLLLALPAGGVRLTATATKSETLSPGALTAAQALLQEAALTISSDGYDLVCGDDLLLQARADAAGGFVACGNQAAPLAVAAFGSADVWQTARELGALLASWEQEVGAAVDLQEAGVAARQLVYVLTGEEWAQVWPQAVQILCACAPEAAMLAEAQIVGKGTLKRYFDRDGNEMGLYFYAAELRVHGETREVRLEYGFQAGKGLYAAFRCPNKNETRNIRLALHGKKTKGGWSLNGSLRLIHDGDSEVYALDGRTDGTLKLSLNRKRGGDAAQYALTLAMQAGGAQYQYQKEKRLALAGAVQWQAVALTEASAAAPNGDMAQVSTALAGRLLALARAASPDHWQELVHALATETLVNAQQNAAKEAE